MVKFPRLTFVVVQVYFYDIPDEVIDNMVKVSLKHILCYTFLLSSFFYMLIIHWVTLMMANSVQIEEGVYLNVAGGLMLEHPLILPLVESMVITSLSLSLSLSQSINSVQKSFSIGSVCLFTYPK